MHSKDKKLCTVFYLFFERCKIYFASFFVTKGTGHFVTLRLWKIGTGLKFHKTGKWGQLSFFYFHIFITMILWFYQFLIKIIIFIWLKFPLICFIHYVNIKVMLLFCLNFIWFIYTLKIMWYCRVTRKIIKSIRTYIVYRNLCIII